MSKTIPLIKKQTLLTFTKTWFKTLFQTSPTNSAKAEKALRCLLEKNKDYPIIWVDSIRTAQQLLEEKLQDNILHKQRIEEDSRDVLTWKPFSSKKEQSEWLVIDWKPQDEISPDEMFANPTGIAILHYVYGMEGTDKLRAMVHLVEAVGGFSYFWSYDTYAVIVKRPKTVSPLNQKIISITWEDGFTLKINTEVLNPWLLK